MTREEAEAIYIAGQEREFKKHAVNLLSLRGAWIFEQPMHRRTSGKLGVPDILACYKSRFVAIELKVTGQTLRFNQAKQIFQIRKAGGYAIVAYRLRDIQEILNAIDLL